MLLVEVLACRMRPVAVGCGYRPCPGQALDDRNGTIMRVWQGRMDQRCLAWQTAAQSCRIPGVKGVGVAPHSVRGS
jgi:hypothetical protein